MLRCAASTLSIDSLVYRGASSARQLERLARQGQSPGLRERIPRLHVRSSSKKKKSGVAGPRTPADQLDPDRVPVIQTKGKGKSHGHGHDGHGHSGNEDRLRSEEGGSGDRAKYDADEARERISRALDRFQKDISDVCGRGGVGRPSTGLLEGIMVETKSTKGGRGVALRDLANVTINTKGGRPAYQLLVYNPDDMADIERAIQLANLGASPVREESDGPTLRLPIPRPSEETRRALHKRIKDSAEQHRISLRSIRHEALRKIDADDKSMLSRQTSKLKSALQKEIDDGVKMISKHLAEAEEELLLNGK